jgi:hypothetical protein
MAVAALPLKEARRISAPSVAMPIYANGRFCTPASQLRFRRPMKVKGAGQKISGVVSVGWPVAMG